MSKESYRWTHELTGYHWFVFFIASAAWLFDCLDQRLFSLARNPALKELMAAGGDAQETGKVVTALFLIGWGVGGLIFGPLGDRFGRAKMLSISVLIYSACTGLTFFSQSYQGFAAYRFLTGLGVGGVFGLAVSLIAETLPGTARAGALGMLQILSTVGNLAAGGFKFLIDHLESSKIIEAGDGWRWMFLVGALPALMIVLTMKYLREPEPWLKLKAEGRLPKGAILAPYISLVSDREWRRNLIVGALIASTGVIGLWAIGEYLTDLQKLVFTQHFERQNLPADKVSAAVENARTWAYVLQMVGAGVGMWIFTKFAIAMGRRAAFAIGFTAALISTLYVYWKMDSPVDAYWMMPIMSAAQLSVFAGFAIYLPELFPSRLRSTGTSFCYNLGRFAAAGGSFFSAKLATDVFGNFGSPLKERYSAMAMCAIFLVGLATLPFAPETKGKPLPE
jgi:Major Facilitator Superfamily